MTSVVDEEGYTELGEIKSGSNSASMTSKKSPSPTDGLPSPWKGILIGLLILTVVILSILGFVLYKIYSQGELAGQNTVADVVTTAAPDNIGELAGLNTVADVVTTAALDNIVVRDCGDIKGGSGIYNVNIAAYGAPPVMKSVYCDMNVIDPGWLVLMRRFDGLVKFDREWADYKEGFGNLEGEFWLGNELMHAITTNGRKYRLRVDLQNYNGTKLFAVYGSFLIASETLNYTLYVADYDVISTLGDSLGNHNGMQFSTLTRDNDIYAGNCVQDCGAPWWMESCHYVFLTGAYGQYPAVDRNKGLRWSLPWGNNNFAKVASMMIRT